MLCRVLLLVSMACLVGAACGSSTKTGAPSTTNPPTTLASDNTPAITPTTPTVVTTGRQSAYVVSVNLAKHTVTFDAIEYLTGAAATAKFKEMNPGASRGPLNDYVIVNETKDAFVRPLAPNAVVKVVRTGGTVHTKPVAVPQSTLATYPGRGNSPFWLTITNGTVTEIDEQFIP